MEITVDDTQCWVCGNEFSELRKKTMHHTLPRHLRPKRNVVIPICESCHDRVTAEDPQAVHNFAYKMMRQTIAQTRQITELVKLTKDRVNS